MPVALRKLSSEEAQRAFPHRGQHDLSDYVDALRGLEPGQAAGIDRQGLSDRAIKRRLGQAAKGLGYQLKWSRQAAAEVLYFQVIGASPARVVANGRRHPRTEAAKDEHAARTAFDREYASGAAPQASPQTAIDVAAFDQAYAAGTPPWAIGAPQPAIVRVLEAGLLSGRVLDIGCGTGENAVFLAESGLFILGVDASAIAIDRARAHAAARQVTAVRFVVADARRLPSLGEPFDAVLDCGLLHTLSDADRATVLAGVRAVLRPGGLYLLLCFSEHAVARGPRRSTQAELRAQFQDGWQVEAILPAHFQLTESWASPEAMARDPEDMGAAAWLAHVRRL